MRRTIARRLLLSKQTVPHFYVRQTINADRLAAHYAGCKARFPCSLNDLVLLAAARVVAEFPAFRSRLEGDDLVEAADAHIGLAIALADGLVVPAVLNADRLSLSELAAETRRIAGSARLRDIENMGKSVFTVSNLGMYGTEEFAAIINPPESAILAVGSLREQAMAREGILYAGKALTLTLSCDHRVIDGVCAAQFMGRLKQILESAEQFLK
jgi:pyruvate dehydrogenase E2 component (dihydrolipoamide acetyltransferase)